jgi:hypothetical protein
MPDLRDAVFFAGLQDVFFEDGQTVNQGHGFF